MSGYYSRCVYIFFLCSLTRLVYKKNFDYFFPITPSYACDISAVKEYIKFCHTLDTATFMDTL